MKQDGCLADGLSRYKYLRQRAIVAPFAYEQSLRTGAAQLELRLSTQLAFRLALRLAGFQFTYSA